MSGAGRGAAFRSLSQLVARCRDLEEALEAFADPRHWGVRPEYDIPRYEWIGTYTETPIEFARRILDEGAL